MSPTLKVLCIIPARGGSKRVPRKNVLPVAGKPLLAHSIEHALGSKHVNRVVVSTEDAEIAAVTRACGAEVVERPPELASDMASSESALRHVVEVLAVREDYRPDLVVFLQCTSPVRNPDDTDRAVEHLLATGADSCFSGCRSHALIWRQNAGGVEPMNYDYHRRQREQDRPREWVENGSIFVFKPWLLFERDNRLGGKIAVYEMDLWRSFQIDSPEELALCEWILSRPRQIAQNTE